MTAATDFDALLETFYALIRAMEEESDLLALSGPAAEGVEELAATKIRLADRLERLAARLDRRQEGWVRALDADSRTRLAEANTELRKAAIVNSDVLERQIMLSTELLQAVGLELERMAGSGTGTYGRLGDIRRRQAGMPLALNQRY